MEFLYGKRAKIQKMKIRQQDSRFLNSFFEKRECQLEEKET
jgi:hypothetical protein